ncbi:MAG: maturation protein [Sanya fiers-like virus 55]|nr:MAG: maturation protein [Sanya fiers-like virus 55]
MPENYITRQTTIPTSGVAGAGSVTVTDTLYLDLVRSRVKPSPLYDTWLIIGRSRSNHGSYTRQSAGGSCTGRWSGSLSYVLSCYAPTFTKRPSPGAAAVGLSQNAAIANLGEGDLNIGVALAELNDTVGYLGTLIRRLGEFGSALKKGNLAGAAKALAIGGLSKRAEKRLRNQTPSQRLAQGYLEYQFALRPLISDAQGAVDAYHRKVVNGMVIRSGSGPRGSKGRAPEVFPSGPSGPGKNVNLPPLKPRTTIRGVVSNANARKMQEMGLINLAEAAWNGLPFSFLLDYFLPIGDYLATLTATSGLSGVSMCTVTYSSNTAYLKNIFWYCTEDVNRTTLNAIPSALSRFPTLGAASQSAQQITNMVMLARARL